MGTTDQHVDDQSRRRFVRTAAYTAPFILTLRAEPAFASYGSGGPGPLPNGRHLPSQGAFEQGHPQGHTVPKGLLQRLLALARGGSS